MLYATTGNGLNTVIHCLAGIGRTGISAAGILLHAGYEAVEAFERVGTARGMEVPDTEEQREWIISNSAEIRNTQNKCMQPTSHLRLDAGSRR